MADDQPTMPIPTEAKDVSAQSATAAQANATPQPNAAGDNTAPQSNAAVQSTAQEAGMAFVDAANPYAPEPPVDPKQSRRNLIIGIIAGCVVIVVAIIVAFFVHEKIVSDAQATGTQVVSLESNKQAGDEADDAQESAAEAEELQVRGAATPWGEVLDTEKVRWEVDGTEAQLYDVASGQLVGVAFTVRNVTQGDSPKSQRYIIGQANVQGEQQPVNLALYYLEGGKLMHWSAAGGQTAVQSGALSLDDIAAAIKLASPTGLMPIAAANIALQSDEGSRDAGSPAVASGEQLAGGKFHTGIPFWGIWIGASKDQDAAERIADDARSKGFSAGATKTTYWTNLNSDPWWVVTAGCYDSEAEARAALASVQGAGYPDAYVKYSGEYH